MILSDRRPRRMLLPAAGAAAILVFALSGCAASGEPAPSPTNTESLYTAADGAESSANSFFSLLAAGDIAPEFVQVEPEVDLDLEKPLSALLAPEVYAQVQDRPKIQSVDDVAASE
ncbi:MAG: hypothetical protein ACTH0V_17090, partial [Microbacteriaceae bacterium]